MAFIHSGINEKSIYDGALCTIVDAKDEMQTVYMIFELIDNFLITRKIRINKKKLFNIL